MASADLTKYSSVKLDYLFLVSAIIKNNFINQIQFLKLKSVFHFQF